MKHLELDLEHHYKNKFVGRHRFRAGGKTLVIGQAKDADIRLLGEDVSSVHAFIEYNDGSWCVLDAGGGKGTWVSKRPVVEEQIKEETVVTIGSHYLKLIPKIINTEVFSEKKLQLVDVTEPIDNVRASIYHQVIVRKDGLVKNTYLLAQDMPFDFFNDNQEHRILPPKMGEIKNSQFGSYAITQRLAKAQHIPFGLTDLKNIFNDKEMRVALSVSIIFMLILGVLIFAIPHKPAANLTDLQPDNKYNRMIFDSELVKKKRAEAKEMRKSIRAASPRVEPPRAQNTLETPAKSKGAPQKIVSKLKLQSLSALLGKISKRANAKGPMIVGFGKTADNTNTGTSRTMAAISGSPNTTTDAIGNGGEVYKVAAVGTLGKGGGKGGSLSGLGGLSAEGIGNGTVGIIDQETEIEGGLDKEIIAQYIKNYLGEIRYCYERQLSAEPDLYGKVQVKFTIDGNGAVSEYRVGMTTLNSAMVEGCILRRLARWKFPKPKGGTNVLVTYPFMFKSTN